MDIVVSKSLAGTFPIFTSRIQAIVEDQQAVELLRLTVEDDLQPRMKTVMFRHAPASIHRTSAKLTTLVLEPSEYWSVHPELEAVVAQLQTAVAPNVVQVIMIGMASDPAYASRLEDAERSLVAIQMRRRCHYFFVEDLEVLAESICYSAAARNPFLCCFRETSSGVIAEDIEDETGRYMNILLRISGFTIPNARAVVQAFPTPQDLLNAFAKPSGNQDGVLEMEIWEHLQPWAKFLWFHLELISNA
ncbi:hypothetical protein V5O48_013065 [Marasmius crinis-equi]|uniref:Uncharacterized protein n=1 Tax=Marasmius crinis-equi TaxID=585013 RepID=A0ABR3F142_9AGAR